MAPGIARVTRPKSKKGATDFSVAPRVVPSPRYFAKFKLLQRWPCGAGASCPRCFRRGVPIRVVVDDTVFVRAKAAHATLVERTCCAADGVIRVRHASRGAA